MSSSEAAPRRGRGRPRTPGAAKRTLDAALEEYGEHGWSGFTMDGVARRAGVGKSTVYLRWQDKESLLTDAVAMSRRPRSRSASIGWWTCSSTASSPETAEGVDPSCTAAPPQRPDA